MERTLQLVKRARREPQIDRAALFAILLDVFERPPQDEREFVGISRLVGRQARLRDADQGRADRLMGAAFGCKRNAARRGDQQESDRKSTRLNSSHPSISYAVYCL